MWNRPPTAGFGCVLLLAGAALGGEGPAGVTAPTIDPLPAGWTHGADTPAVHQGENAELKAFFDVTAEPKTMAFADWCGQVKNREDKRSELSGARDTPVRAAKIGGYNVMTYDSTGQVFGEPAHSRIYCVELPDRFARLSCTGFERVWDKASAVLDDLVKNMK